jgi:hypothetical protein
VARTLRRPDLWHGETLLVRRTNGLRIAVLAAGIAGAMLFVWSIRSAGVAGVLDGVRRVGWWFVAIWSLGGLRYLVRAAAWRLSLDVPRELPMATAFGAALMGDALGNVTPLGALVSEPSKVLLVRDRLGAAAAVAAVTIENLFYTATVGVVFVFGAGALLLSFDTGPGIRHATLITLAVAVVMALGSVVVLIRRVRVASALVAALARWPILHDAMATRRAAVSSIEDQVFGFVSRHPGRIAPLLSLEASYHAAAVLEIWLAATLITGAPLGFVAAFVLEFVNRTITIAFQFVPLWLGVDEAGTGLVTTALQMGAAAGVGLALVRKARVVSWTALGLGLFFVLHARGRTPPPQVMQGEPLSRASRRWRAM